MRDGEKTMRYLKKSWSRLRPAHPLIFTAMKISRYLSLCAVGAISLAPISLHAEGDVHKACIDGTGTGWRAMTKEDFTKVNLAEDVFTFSEEGISSKGNPIGVIRTVKEYKNFELVVEWKMGGDAGNSGVFCWATPDSIKKLEEGAGQEGKPQLPDGIEVQILDHGYTAAYEKESGKKADWFTTNGDVFPCGVSKMTPFLPKAPNRSRAFPNKNLSKGVGQWNHYYIRAINGELRLWVNGEEVSGGTGCNPSSGFLCLESEGTPCNFRNLRIRELP